MIKTIHDLFNHRGARKFFLLLRVPLGLAAAAAILCHVAPAWFWPGAAVALLGAILQWWCFGCIMTGKELAAKGPYRFVRNPMYLSRFLLCLGFLMMTGSLMAMGVFAVLYYLYMLNRVRREEVKLASRFGAPYEDYCRRVNRFLPGLPGLRGAAIIHFDPACFARNHGYFNMLMVLASLGLFLWFGYLHPVKCP